MRLSRLTLKSTAYGRTSRTDVSAPLVPLLVLTNTRRDISKPKKPKYDYPSWSKERQEAHNKRNAVRRTKRKAELVRRAGGKCVVCGYDRCIAALQFHHRDPATKLFTLTTGNLTDERWEAALVEAAKCDLLCVRCHVEFHNQPR